MTCTQSCTHTHVEEEAQASCSGGEMMDRNHKPNEDQSGLSVFTTLGTLVLTARPYESVYRNTKPHPNTNSSERSALDSNGASLQGEIFQKVNREVNDIHVHVLMYRAKFILCLFLALNILLYSCAYSCLHYMYMYMLTKQAL